MAAYLYLGRTVVFLIILLHNSMILTGQNIKIFGHRGCRGLLPENSIAAFNKAIDIGVDGIEWDVVVNKNKELIISHEAYIDNSYCKCLDGNSIQDESKENLNIYNMTTEDINKYDCGSIYRSRFPNQTLQKSRKPSVKQAFSEINFNNNTEILFEIKSSPTDYNIYQPKVEEYCKIIYNELINNTRLEYIVFMSFDRNILNELVKLLPNNKYIYLIYNPLKSYKTIIEELNFEAFGLGIYHHIISETTIKQAHNNNIKIYAWTVNTNQEAQKLINKGVDGIITDYPNLFIK
jgi:glycerophosphoryl diester phosphodiesterase